MSVGQILPPESPAVESLPSPVAGLALAPPSTTVVPRSRGGWHRLGRVARRCIGLMVLVGLWELASSTGYISQTVLATPWAVLHSAAHLFANGTLTTAMLVSLRRVGEGLLLGGTIGLVLALVSGLSRIGEDLIDAPMQMLRTVPFAGLVPLLVIWLGIGEKPKVALVAMAAAFPLYLNTVKGVRATDPSLLEAGRSVGLTRLGMIRHVVLPAALPDVLLGLRVSLGVSWLALVFAEQVNATSGLGSLMTNAQELFQTDVIIDCLLVYALLGLASDLLVRGLESRLLAWRPTDRTAAA